MSGERTFQQLDPLGALIGRPMTYVVAAGIPIYAAVMTWLNRFDIVYPLLAVVALAIVTLISAVLVFGSSPLRAPFSRRMHVGVTGAATLAYVVSTHSMWQSNAFVRDDWGPVVIGLALLSLSQYRPPKEIAATGLALALFVGLFTLLQAFGLSVGVPTIVFSLVTMFPVIALSLASATFGELLIEGLVRWRRRAQAAVSSYATENTGWIARSVQQDRVTILNQEVVPFFADVLHRGAITADDRERARRISDTIRVIMVAEVDRTWLDSVVEQVAGSMSDDPDRLAVAMTMDQRTATRAAIVALAQHPAFSARAFSLSIRAVDELCTVTLEATLETADSILRGQIAPYLAVIRILFADVKADFSNPTLTLRFSYEQR